MATHTFQVGVPSQCNTLLCPAHSSAHGRNCLASTSTRSWHLSQTACLSAHSKTSCAASALPSGTREQRVNGTVVDRPSTAVHELPRIQATLSELEDQMAELHARRTVIQREYSQGLVDTPNFVDPRDELHGVLCDFGLPDAEICGSVDAPPAELSTQQEAWSRGRWLLGLLVLQSTSSFVLDSYQELLKHHLVVTLFLTMLVGAGGNAGNQSAIKVIRGLATGHFVPTIKCVRETVMQQTLVGLLLGTGLSVAGFARVYLTNGDISNAAAISAALFMIVMASVVLGTALPFGMAKLGVDPANAGTSIQVLMDITGVLITCATCHFVLDQLAVGLQVA